MNRKHVALLATLGLGLSAVPSLGQDLLVPARAVVVRPGRVLDDRERPSLLAAVGSRTQAVLGDLPWATDLAADGSVTVRVPRDLARDRLDRLDHLLGLGGDVSIGAVVTAGLVRACVCLEVCTYPGMPELQLELGAEVGDGPALARGANVDVRVGGRVFAHASVFGADRNQLVLDFDPRERDAAGDLAVLLAPATRYPPDTTVTILR